MAKLNNFSYTGYHRYFITLRCYRQASYFNDGNLINKVSQILKEIAKRRDFQVWVYCFMPDHLHLLIEGKSDNADTIKFISVFKQRTAFEFRRLFNAKLWQPGYYDRVLRRDESTSAVIRYICENPVRKGLVSDYLKYPYLGSFELPDVSHLFI